MEIKKPVKTETETKWVISKDGIRMTYKEYMDMIESERN